MPAVAKKRKFDLKELTPEQRRLIQDDWTEEAKFDSKAFLKAIKGASKLRIFEVDEKHA